VELCRFTYILSLSRDAISLFVQTDFLRNKSLLLNPTYVSWAV
jgi:hypothetical protein